VETDAAMTTSDTKQQPPMAEVLPGWLEDTAPQIAGFAERYCWSREAAARLKQEAIDRARKQAMAPPEDPRRYLFIVMHQIVAERLRSASTD
jgi:DNA-directed RNA polymerase specialized sigma24 family protein